jgi:hypothetical protein
MEFAYQFGEMDGWRSFFQDAAVPMFVLKCSKGHMLDSPIDLPKAEIDKRCMKCGRR